MRGHPLLLIVALALPVRAADQRPRPALRPVSVAQLEQMLTRAHAESDRQLAQEMALVQLTERLSDARWERWEAQMPGNRSRAALEVIADGSVFLALPAADLPSQPAPDLATQRKIMAQTVDYVQKLDHTLPNLFATRKTVAFLNTQREVMARPGQGMIGVWQPMKQVSRMSSIVTYRDGQEVETSQTRKLRPSHSHPLVTRGEFGPVLAMVLYDAAHGQLDWSHWEGNSSASSGPSESSGPLAGLEAVFQYYVPFASSHYQPGYCCVDGKVWHEQAAYHGEIAVDPEDGVVRRLTLETELPPGSPLFWTGTMVQYGPVNLGRKSYACPLRTVSITQAKPGAMVSTSMKMMADALPPDYTLYGGPLQTLLNDTVFENYHLFHATVRILPTR